MSVVKISLLCRLSVIGKFLSLVGIFFLVLSVAKSDFQNKRLFCSCGTLLSTC